MSTGEPRPLTSNEMRVRRRRVARIAKQLGFVGRIEYRHVKSQSGGAQYGCGSNAAADLLTVFAEAFDRDADPQDFSLEAMIAHECGHQILARHPRISRRIAGVSEASEKILASLLGSMLCANDADKVALYAKAAADLLAHGQGIEVVNRHLQELFNLLEALL